MYVCEKYRHDRSELKEQKYIFPVSLHTIIGRKLFNVFFPFLNQNSASIWLHSMRTMHVFIMSLKTLQTHCYHMQKNKVHKQHQPISLRYLLRIEPRDCQVYITIKNWVSSIHINVIVRISCKFARCLRLLFIPNEIVRGKVMLNLQRKPKF